MPAEPKNLESRKALSAMLRELNPEDVRSSRRRREMAGNLAYLAILNTVNIEARAKEIDARRRVRELFQRFGEQYDERDTFNNVINSPEGSAFMVTTEDEDGLKIYTNRGHGVYSFDDRSGEKVFFGAAIFKDNWDNDELYVIRPGNKVPLKANYEITLVDLPEEIEEKLQ